MTKLWEKIKEMNESEPIPWWIRLPVTIAACYTLWWATIGEGIK